MSRCSHPDYGFSWGNPGALGMHLTCLPPALSLSPPSSQRLSATLDPPNLTLQGHPVAGSLCHSDAPGCPLHCTTCFFLPFWPSLSQSSQVQSHGHLAVQLLPVPGPSLLLTRHWPVTQAGGHCLLLALTPAFFSGLKRGPSRWGARGLLQLGLLVTRLALQGFTFSSMARR